MRTLLDDATRTLDDAGVPSARHDAEALAAHLLGIPRTALLLTSADLDADVYRALVERRAAREPLQHIVGTAPFRRIELAVGPGVFVPRPETEVVVDAALAAIADVEAPLVVDLCSGSGAIGLSIAVERPDATVHAVELSGDAAVWLRGNAARWAPHVHVTNADVADPSLLADLEGRFDLVVSNPPYVAEHEMDAVDPEVRDHDPQVALVAGPDGLDIIRAVAATAARLLRPGGAIVVEHSDRQGVSAPAVLRLQGFADVTDHQDLSGRDRYANGRAPQEPNP
ncbi:MAG TPA: peptide chain release factor N(5)-glutamine methyltransferase [Mycobacteriales bacterium]|nr:peptide chain release factor N(5)-glutamine methyltransferase [Mycobacteriales bacterium]